MYKNLFPGDYADAYEKKGCLYSVFSKEKKHLYYDGLLEESYTKFRELSEMVRQTEEAIVHARRMVVDWLVQQYSVTELVKGGKVYKVDDFATNEFLFDLLKHNSIDKYCYEEDGEIKEDVYMFEFDKICEAVDTDGIWEAQLSAFIRDKQKTTANLQSIKKHIDGIKGQRVSSLLKQNGAENAKTLLRKACEDVIVKEGTSDINSVLDVLSVFVSAGYVDDDYPSYMSYSYDGTLSDSDFSFLNAVLRYESLGYDYKLDNCSAIFSRLSTENFKDKSILNVSLLNYLLKDVKQTSAMLDLFVKTARIVPEFVVLYANTPNHQLSFYKRLYDGWEEPINFVMSINDSQLRNDMLYLFFKTSPSHIRLSEVEKKIIATMYDFITRNINDFTSSSLMAFLEEQHIVFERIQQPSSTTRNLYYFVVKEGFFAITPDNLRVIYGRDFDLQSLTAICNGDKSIAQYLLKDMNALLDIFPDTDLLEGEEAIKLVVNDMEMSDERVDNFIKRQTQFVTPSNVNVKRLPMLYKYNLIVKTWENVYFYFKNHNSINDVVSYVRSNIDELSKTICTADIDGKLQSLLLMNHHDWTTNEYEKLVACFDHPFSSDDWNDDLNEEYLPILIERGLIPYHAWFVGKLKEYGTKIFTQYLTKYFDEFDNDDEVEVEWTNELSTAFLESNVSLEKKIKFLNLYCSLNDDDSKAILAKLVCVCYNQAEDLSNADLELIGKSLMVYQEEHSWETKISLINKLHAHYGYEKQRTTSYLNALAGGYVELNKLGAMISWFDDNVQNRELLEFLRQNKHCVSKATPIFGRIKVSHRRK